MRKLIRQLFFIPILFIASCNSDDNHAEDHASNEGINDSLLVDAGLTDNIYQIDLPITLVHDSLYLGTEDGLSALSEAIQNIVLLPEDWMHPAGFDFTHGISNELIGQIPHEEYQIYLTYHEGYESTLAGHFEASFFQLHIFNSSDQLIDQKEIAGLEQLKDGGMGHTFTSYSTIEEDLTIKMHTSIFQFDYEDGATEEYENEFDSTFQIQQNGRILTLDDQ